METALNILRGRKQIRDKGQINKNQEEKGPFDFVDDEESASSSARCPEGSEIFNKWHVSANLTYITNRKIRDWSDILEDLEIFVDKYEGPFLPRPIFELIYSLLGTHIVSVKPPNSSLKKFRSELDIRMEIRHQFGQIGPKSDISWSYQHPGPMRKCHIVFNCELNPTVRSGHSYKKLFNTEANPTLPHPSIHQVVAPYKIAVLSEDEIDYTFGKLD